MPDSFTVEGLFFSFSGGMSPSGVILSRYFSVIFLALPFLGSQTDLIL